MRLRAICFVLFGTLVLAIGLEPVDADDPVSSSVSFNREVIRIIQRKCEPCHAPGGLAMSLSDYRDARAWGRAIREELVEHRMPPAIVARGYGRYESDPSLNAREMATFLTWLDGGMPRGDEADRPPAAATVDTLEEIEANAGVRLSLPAQTVPAREELVIRRVTIDASAAAGRAIARVQFRPGNRRVLRGALVFATSSNAGSTARNPLHENNSLWIGGWLPWQHAVVPPTKHAFHLPASATLVVDLYYRGGESELTDRSSIDVSFAPETAKGRIDEVMVEASDNAGTRARGSVKLTLPTSIWAIHPEAAASVKSMELRAERPDRSTEVLLWIPKARADWPLALVMQEPVTLPAGSTVSLVVETSATPPATSRPRVTMSVLK
jgi:hypothetical protein